MPASPSGAYPIPAAATEIDRALLEEYGERLSLGDDLPPVLVVDDGERCWLADGYHRWHVHKALALPDIAAAVVRGKLRDAIRLSLQANATHGKRREAADYRRAYALAVRYGVAPAADVEAVAAALHCSERWARELTKQARAEERAARDAEVLRRKEEGESNRQIAREVGVDEWTVRNLSGGAGKRKPAETPRSDPTPQSDAPQSDPVRSTAEQLRAGLDYFERPEVKAWHRVLEALRVVNALADPAELFADRCADFDHAIGPELELAAAARCSRH